MTYTWIKQLSSLSKAKDKEKLLEQAWKAGERKLFEGLQLGLNPYMFYHFNTIALITEKDDADDGINWQSFKRFINLISNKSLTGGKLQAQVTEWVDTAAVDMWNEFYRRILLKNWEQTITITTYNRAMNRLSKNDIQATKFICPTLGYQKFQIGEAGQFIGGEYFVDPFIDGKRQLIVALKNQNILKVWDKKYLDIEINGGAEFLKPLPIDIVLDTMYDGETWFVIDVAPVEQFKDGFVNHSLMERHDALCGLHELLLESFGGKVKILAKKKISLNESNKLQEALTDLEDQGFSYAVVKESRSLYKFGKNNHWVKVKT